MQCVSIEHDVSKASKDEAGIASNDEAGIASDDEAGIARAYRIAWLWVSQVYSGVVFCDKYEAIGSGEGKIGTWWSFVRALSQGGLPWGGLPAVEGDTLLQGVHFDIHRIFFSFPAKNLITVRIK